MEDFYLNKYAEIILKRGLNLQKGDVLSINTEEENSEFAHLVAKAAHEITGLGVFINYIKDGKVEDTEEAMTEFPINKRPSALLHIPTYKSYEDIELDKEYSARELQAYRLLSEPLTNQTPSTPYATAYLPSQSWDEEEIDLNSSSLLSEVFSLEEDDVLSSMKESADILNYEKNKLNNLNLVKGRIYSEEGVDLEFEFLPHSHFETSEEITTNGRKFIPTLFTTELFRALDKNKTNGYLNITKPIMLFGKKLANLSIAFRNGRITEFSALEDNGKLFDLFLKQDSNALFASELIIAEENNNDVDFFALPEWDRMRGCALTLGGARAKGLSDEDIDKLNDSLVTLTLPIHSSTLTIECEDDKGCEYTILEDGILTEED